MIRQQAERILRRWERLRAARGPHGVILIYHRVATPAADPWGIAVSPHNFATHMEILRAFAVPRTLGDFASRLETASGPERSIVVTFDDGYTDNLGALPVLEANEVPATIFIVSRAVGNPQAFWWDALTRIFLETPVLPERLTLDLGSKRLTYDLGDVARYDAEALARAARWRADHDVPENSRQRAYLDLWQHLVGLPPDRIAAAAAFLAGWAGLGDAPPASGGGRPVTSEELARTRGVSAHRDRRAYEDPRGPVPTVTCGRSGRDRRRAARPDGDDRPRRTQLRLPLRAFRPANEL